MKFRAGRANTKKSAITNYEYSYIYDALLWSALAVMGAYVFGIGDVLAQVTVSGSDWVSGIQEKGDEFKSGLLSLAALAVGIGGAIWLLWGALAGDIPWRRIASLAFAAIGLAVLDQVVQALTE